MSALDQQDRDLQLDLRNKAVKRAGWQGWRYGMGVGLLVVIAYQWASPHEWSWIVPALIAGATFGPLGAAVFTWMEVMRQKP